MTPLYIFRYKGKVQCVDILSASDIRIILTSSLSCSGVNMPTVILMAHWQMLFNMYTFTRQNKKTTSPEVTCKTCFYFDVSCSNKGLDDTVPETIL